MTIRSEEFDDIYFAPEDGVAETRHVFLAGNGLPARWQGRDHFTIAETGFGTGLNFLCAWDLFEKTAGQEQALDYISFEKYPLSPADIKKALSGWQDLFGDKLARMLAAYPLRIPGFHKVRIDERVSLTLIFDDVNEALPQLTVPRGVDCWFLDGFAPAKNPEMWSETLFSHMGTYSAAGATAATFTVAGMVKRGLAEAGFAIEKTPGYGRKREMLRGRFERQGIVTNTAPPAKRVAVIGGGLAGTSCAYILKQNGIEPVIYEASDTLAAGASGNAIGLCNPRLTAGRSAEGDFYNAAFAQAVRLFPKMAGTGYRRCGALHLAIDNERYRKLSSLPEKNEWHDDHMRFVDTSMAGDLAGIKLPCEALYLPDAGFISPGRLCHAYAKDIEVHLNSGVDDFSGVKEDAVILACGNGIAGFPTLSWLPLHPVRGQVSYIDGTAGLSGIKAALCYGGYVTPRHNGRQVTGATFQNWQDHCDVVNEDHDYNLENLRKALDLQAGNVPQVTGGRAALRCSSKDRFPVIGTVPDMTAWQQGKEENMEGVYILAGLGSHGIISSLAGAQLLADKIQGRPYSLPLHTIEALSPSRFPRRMKRKGQL